MVMLVRRPLSPPYVVANRRGAVTFRRAHRSSHPLSHTRCDGRLTINVSAHGSLSGALDRAVQVVALPAPASLLSLSGRSGASSAHLATGAARA
ncbi:hypothetical protein XAC3810_280006 [Xanthomonas citri pv. citri]|uniref:Uncharacterized protein n=1 Tax=Xanthomonas citri pv. citri TaxID=611301 RepID=A0A0U5BS77_XANCI|nr:hypothetical protein XAC3824_280057 [Xanthomonas citri pv. citri]CEE24387.1 hypothetical protein XAC1083_270006 [Xanthomonas citri pv. citri]CEE32781.1 hypothetical protein XAC3810_280006 [Xanthomonas citri pv. citri]CEE35074.1 hypothetical protein XAC902_330108 [Xanthomonas citri pv. citri]CEE35425.1 hypothetical protein XAC2911_250189 [Xanthomonas citri pv. citri]